MERIFSGRYSAPVLSWLILFILTGFIQPACASDSSVEGQMTIGITIMLVGFAVMIGFLVIVLGAGYWAAKRSTAGFRENLVAGLDVPKGSAVRFPDTPFFILYFIISFTFCFLIVVVSFFVSIASSSEPLRAFATMLADTSTFWFFPFIVLMISLLFLVHPLRKIEPVQKPREFSCFRFLIVIGCCCVIFAGLSSSFDSIAANANPGDGNCDICGDRAQYELTVNGVHAHEFCALHAYIYYIFNPLVIIEDSSLEDPVLLLIPLLYAAYHWIFGIGIAVIAGKGYGWSLHCKPLPVNCRDGMQYECTMCHATFPSPLKQCPECGGPVIGVKKP